MIPFDAVRAVNAIDFEVLFTYLDWRDAEIAHRRRMAEKSEILIPDIVPLRMIKGRKDG